MPALKKKYRTVDPPPSEPKPTITPAFVDLDNAAVYLGVTYWNIYRLVKAGKLVAKLVGKRLTVRTADLDKYWEEQPTFVGKKAA